MKYRSGRGNSITSTRPTIPIAAPNRQKAPAGAPGSIAPTVSVFMSCYNAAPFLKESVEAVLDQTFGDFEFLIVNDGSTDGSADYLDSLTDPRVQVNHQENRGLGSPQNQALRRCRGQYVMRMDADDKCDPTRIEKQLSVLKNNPDTIMVGCYYRCFGPDGRTSSISRLPLSHESILAGMLRGWHTMAHGTIMFRRTLLDQSEGYLLNGAGEDWSLLLDAARFGKFAMVPEPLVQVRLHPSSNAWQGAEKVMIGFRFAQQRHKQYLKSKTDLTYEEFMVNWNRAGFITKTGIRLAAYSSVLHRRSVLGRIDGKFFLPLLQVTLAGLLNPSKTIGAIWKRFQTGGMLFD